MSEAGQIEREAEGAVGDWHSQQLEAVVARSAPVLVFLPNTVELQRFVLSGALDGLGLDHRLEFVLPAGEAEKMMAAAPEVLRPDLVHTLDIPAERFRLWSELFQAACFRYAERSRSFALRASPRFAQLSPRQRRYIPWRAMPVVARRLGALQDARLLPVPLRRRFKKWYRRVKPYAAYAEGLALAEEAAYNAYRAERLEGLEPLDEIIEIFDRTNPIYALLPTSLLDLFCNDVLLAGEREQVATVVVQSGWDNLSSKGIVNFKPAAALVWGKQSRQHALGIQGLEGEGVPVLPIGAAQYSALTPCSTERRAELRRQLGAAEDEKLVLFGGSFRQFDEISTLRWLDKLITAGKLPPMKLVYRPHPWRATRADEDDFFEQSWSNIVFDPVFEERYRRVKEDPSYLKREVPIYDMRYLADLLTSVDAVISPMSTLLIEALVLDRPTLAIAFPDDKHEYNPSVTAQMTHFEVLRRTKVLLWCYDRRRLTRQVKRLLALDTHAADYLKRRDALLSQVLGGPPEGYAERLREQSREVLEPRGRKQRSQRTAARRKHMSHSYGAQTVAREYCGLPPPVPDIWGYWMHGWLPEFHNIHPALIALHKKDGQHEGYDFLKQIEAEKRDVPQWVSRQDQAEYLIGFGYRKVRAIGLPVCYLPDRPVERVPGSLLVMPPHSHHCHGPGDPLAERYADQILAIRDRFTHVYVSLNEDDYRTREWVDAFEKRGISVFVSSDQGNPRTLQRLRQILSSFEYVTTNGYGSHIAYAAMFGAKVSIYGEFADFPIERMRRTHALKMFPRLLDEAVYLCSESAMRQHYGQFFVEPDKAVERVDWGRKQVGWENRLSPDGLAEAFHWRPPGASADRCTVAMHGLQADGASRKIGEREVVRPRVLLALAHAGFVRNYESLIRALVGRGFEIDVLLSKAHERITLDHYESLADLDEQFVRFVPFDRQHKLVWQGLRYRVLRDVLFYAHPRMRSARHIQERFQSHQKGVFPPQVLRALRQIAFLMPWRMRRYLDRQFAARDAKVEASHFANATIERTRPDLVVASPLVNFGSREVEVVKAARRRKIPVLLPVASWDNLTNKGRLQVMPDQVAVWNDRMAEEAVKLHGVPRRRVQRVGASVFDWWFEMTPGSDYSNFADALGLDPTQIMLLYVCSSNSIAAEHEERVVKRWIEAVRASSDPAVASANLLVRPHPMAVQNWLRLLGGETRLQRFEGAVVWPLDVRHPTDHDHRQAFYDSLYHASAIIGLNTSVMLEAAIMRRPVFTFLEHEASKGQAGNLHFSYLLEAPFVTVSKTLPQHVVALSRAYAGERTDDEVFDSFVASTIRPRGRERAVGEHLADLVESAINAKQGGNRSVEAQRA